MQNLELKMASIKLLMDRWDPADQTFDDIIVRLAGKTDTAVGQVAGWSNSGVHLQDGTGLRFTYNDEHFSGFVQDGLLTFEGDISDESPSRAAMMAVEFRTGRRPSFNGWAYVWAEVNGQGGAEWVRLSDLRRQAQEAK